MSAKGVDHVPTNKPRVMVTVEEDVYARIDSFRNRSGFASMSQAVNELILKAIMHEEQGHNGHAAFNAEDFDLLNLFHRSDAEGKEDIMKAAIRAGANGKRRRVTSRERVEEDARDAMMIDEITNLLVLYRGASEAERLRALAILTNASETQELEPFTNRVHTREENQQTG